MRLLGQRIHGWNEDRSRLAGRPGKRVLKPRAEVLEGRLLLSADAGAIQARGGFRILEFQGVPFGHDVGGGYAGETLAAFSGGPASTVGEFNATIDWGDQTAPSAGHVGRYASTTDFDVEGGHTYAQTGTYTITVTIEDGDGHSATVTDQATIEAPPLAATPTEFNTVVGRELDHEKLGDFYDARGLQEPDDYHVTIDWGDGTTSLGALDREFSPGGHSPYRISYAIEGSHTYHTPGNFAVTVSIMDDDGHSTTLTTQATVALEDVEYPVPVLFPNGKTLTDVRVATLALPGANASTGDFAATIDWGDGTPATPGQVLELIPSNGGPPVLVVNGSHTYAQSGSYTIRVTVTQDDGATLVAVGPAYALIRDGMVPIHPLPPWNPPVASPPGLVNHPITLGPSPVASPPPSIVVTPSPISSVPIQYTPTVPVVKAIRHRNPVRRHPLRNPPAHHSPAPTHDRSPHAFVMAVRHRKAVLHHQRAVARHAALAASHARARNNHPGS